MTSNISSLQLFQILRQRLGGKEAESLVDFRIKEGNENNLKILASKEDIHLLKEDILRVEGKLDNKISETKTDMVKWLFSFFFALALTILGLYFRK